MRDAREMARDLQAEGHRGLGAYVGTRGTDVVLELLTSRLTPEPDAPEALSVLTLTPEDAGQLAELLYLYAGFARARRDDEPPAAREEV